MDISDKSCSFCLSKAEKRAVFFGPGINGNEFICEICIAECLKKMSEHIVKNFKVKEEK
jgi:hypothetical protein